VVSREAIVAEARTWIGTPFHHQGCVKQVGCDCIGFIAGVALALGIEGAERWRTNPAYHNYSRYPERATLEKGCAEFFDQVPIRDVTLADIFVMRFEREPMHFALITKLDPIYITHALFMRDRVVEHRMDARWQSFVFRACKFRGI
jgi:hypothetical protein